MKEKEKYFIDLSKCSDSEQNHVKTLAGIKNDSERIYLSFSPIQKVWGYFDSIGIKDKTELTYPDFIKLFEGGEGEILSDVAYWRTRCLLAEKCLSESPCDPDITNEQIKAHQDYNQFIETFGNKD